MKDTLIINEKDNVAVRLTEGDGIPAGHKYALCDIAEGEFVICEEEEVAPAVAEKATEEATEETAEPETAAEDAE